MKRITTLTFILIISVILMPAAFSEAKPLSASKQYKNLSFYVEDLVEGKNNAVNDKQRAQLDNGLVARLQKTEKTWSKNKKDRVAKISRSLKANFKKEIAANSAALVQTKAQLSKKYEKSSEEQTDLSSESSSLETLWINKAREASLKMTKTSNPREKLLFLEERASAKRILSSLISPVSSPIEESSSLSSALSSAEKKSAAAEKKNRAAYRQDLKKALSAAKKKAASEKKQISTLESRGFDALDSMPEA